MYKGNFINIVHNFLFTYIIIYFTVIRKSQSFTASQWLSPNIWETLIFYPRHHFCSFVKWLRYQKALPETEDNVHYLNLEYIIKYSICNYHSIYVLSSSTTFWGKRVVILCVFMLRKIPNQQIYLLISGKSWCPIIPIKY